MLATDVEPLGSDSIFWRFLGDWRYSPLAGRPVILQVAHPVVGAGVAEHSTYKTDPWGRLDRTLRSLSLHVYGGPQAAVEGERLQQLHRDIKGVDAHGRRYSALNPEAYLWVHATLYENTLVALDLFGTPLSEAEKVTLFDEWYRLGLLLGLKPTHLPATPADFWQMWADISNKLENNAVVQDVLHHTPKPPSLVPRFVSDPFFERRLRMQRMLVAQTVPDHLRVLFGLPEPTEADRQEVAKLCERMRRAERLPEGLRFVGVPGKARAAALRRARREAGLA